MPSAPWKPDDAMSYRPALRSAADWGSTVESEMTRSSSALNFSSLRPVSEFTLQVWCQACQPFTLEQISKAMTAHAVDPERGQFAPKVADVIRILQGTYTDRAQLAWGKALEAMSSVGAYSDVIFDDPAIHAVIEDLGGWPKVCRRS